MIECHRLTDYALAMSSMKACWHEMCEDDAELKVPDLINEYWIGVYKDKGYAGCFRVAQVTSVMYECHVCILKEFRQYISDITLSFYQWVLDNIQLEKLISNIPSCNKKAIIYALRIGFKKQGVNAYAYKREGKLHAMIQLGIRRKEMEDLCR